MDKQTPREDKAEKAETKTETSATSYRYTGDGGYYAGIPARDLTKDEYDALSDEQKEAVKSGSIYKKGGR